MRKLASIMLVLFILSCGEDGESVYPFDISPYIEFESLRFYDSNTIDTLELSFTIWDREGDLGFKDQIEDRQSPYQIYDVVVDNNENVVTISGTGYELPFFAAPVLIDQSSGPPVHVFFPNQKQLFSEIDNRTEYDCENYEIIVTDTVFVQRNEFHYNLLMDFYTSDDELIDFRAIFNVDDCAFGDFNARIPYVELAPFSEGLDGSAFEISWRDKFSRRVTYRMLSQIWNLSFQDEEFEMKFKVIDRDVNISNVESSGFTTLDEILVD